MKSISVQELLCRRTHISSHNAFCCPPQNPVQPRIREEEDEKGDRIVQNKRKWSSSFSDALCSTSSSHRKKRQTAMQLTGDKCTRSLSNDFMFEFTNPRSKTRILPLSEVPLQLIGRIQLWNNSSVPCSCSFSLDCMAFSDDSGTICCVLTDFDPQFLGRQLRILSWSYIPRREGGGCLEIRRLEVAENLDNPCNSVYLSPEQANVANLVHETPPSKRVPSNKRILLHGCVESISSPFAIPGESRTRKVPRGGKAKTSTLSSQSSVTSEASNGTANFIQASKLSNTAPLLGFFLKLSGCKHKPTCSPSDDRDRFYEDLINERLFIKDSAYVYFSGSPATWRPILLAASGRCISVSGLRRKILMAGETQNAEYNVYTATRTTTVSRLWTSSVINGQKALHTENGLVPRMTNSMDQGCQFGTYIGVVTEIFVRGRLLELDGRTWLLSIHQPLSKVHGLRVGAIVAAHHVHILKLHSLFEQSILLATCSVSHLVVVKFSPLLSWYSGKAESQSCLSRFLETQPFLSAFRSLLVIASFKLKFQGLFSEKDILGSDKNRGIAENYLRTHLGFDCNSKRDVLYEFFSHSAFCQLAVSNQNNYLLHVPPFSNVSKHIQILWFHNNSYIWRNECGISQTDGSINTYRPKQKTFFRKVLSSDTVGITVLGILQFSNDSGNVQIMDSTGSIDAVIPDLQTATYFHEMCLVTTYKLVIEGYNDSSKSIDIETWSLPLSWWSILKGSSGDLGCSYLVSLFLVFNIRDAQLMRPIKPINTGMRQKNEEYDSCTSFDMLLVLHKYPLRNKSFGKSTDCSSSFCIEAVILSYNVSIIPDGWNGFETKAIADPGLCVVSRLCQSRHVANFHGNFARVVAKDGSEGLYTYIHDLGLINEKGNDNARNEVEPKRVLIQFKDMDASHFQVIDIGQIYLVESSLSSTVMSKETGKCLRTVSIKYESDMDVFTRTKMSSVFDSSLPMVDIIVSLQSAFKETFELSIQNAKGLLSPILSVRQIIHHQEELQKYENSELLKGPLISISGVIESLQRLNMQPYQDSCKALLLRDQRGSKVVRVVLDPDLSYTPLGLSRGASVRIHRAVLHLSPEETIMLTCIHSTLIIVHQTPDDISITMHGNSMMKKQGSWINHKFESAPEDEIDIDATSVTNCSKLDAPKLLRVKCRASFNFTENVLQFRCNFVILQFCCSKVVSVLRLVLEVENTLDRHKMRPSEVDLCEWVQYINRISYRVSYACLAIDDGCGLAQCLARDEVAACLLDLPAADGYGVINMSAHESNALLQQLNSVVRKYGVLMIQNSGDLHDLSSDSIAVQVGGDQFLNVEERKTIHTLIKRACQAGPLQLVAEPWCLDNSTDTFGREWMNEINTDNEWPKIIANEVEVLNYENDLQTVCDDIALDLDKMTE